VELSTAYAERLPAILNISLDVLKHGRDYIEIRGNSPGLFLLPLKPFGGEWFRCKSVGLSRRAFAGKWERRMFWFLKYKTARDGKEAIYE
jgi:hypothetical protein